MNDSVLEHPQPSTWPAEAEVVLEAVEAYLRTRRQEAHEQEPVTRDVQTGFFLNTTDRCWLSFEDLLCEITVLFGMRGAGKSNTSEPYNRKGGDADVGDRY